MTVTLRFACQSYSWQMSIDRYRGEVDHMMHVVHESGFAGFEPELVMLGDDWSIDSLRSALDANPGLRLAALVVAESWRRPEEDEHERRRADQAIEAAAALGARLVLVPLPGPDRESLDERQRAIMSCVESVADRASRAGVASTFHANSPDGSVFRTPEDYGRLAELLPPTVGFTPDLGHLARGGLDPLEVVREWGARVDHVHVKDVGADGSWAPTGEGIVDIDGVLRHLEGIGYAGWVTFEDESPEAEADPDAATRRNGAWIASWVAARELAR
ncbi:sugar phosphate isomerase/epimerase family protein [Herbiconiux sp. UC225_62]|uniref:sugar phosphate isomerase/epimerase family protein n=1 Tax=Herbiconiux sp. UC225_62 TaxID=3350168 RepID=UPI0036D2812E